MKSQKLIFIQNNFYLKHCFLQHIYIKLVTTITTKILSVFFYLYMFLIILSNYMAIAESFLKVPIFRGTLVSILFFIHNLLVWPHYYNFIKVFNNLFYLSMAIDNGTWRARVGYILCFETSIFFSYVNI